MSHAVIIAVRGAREAELAAAIGAHPDLSVARRCADLTEAIAASHAGLGAVAIVSEQAHLDRAVLGEFAAAGVAVVGAPSGVDAAEHLTSLGIDEIIAPDGDAVAVAAAVLSAAEDATPVDELPTPPLVAAGGEHGMVVAVWGPAGAPGRTTVAVNLAAEFARTTGNALVVDVDTYGGAVAQALGLLDEAPGIAALARGALNGSLTDDLIARHALTAGEGLRVLSGMTRADRWPELSAAALDPVWPRLREHAAVTVVDCGFCIESDEELAYDTRAPQRNAATLSALAAADVVVVVGSAEPLGVQRLVHALSELGAVPLASGAQPMVVVNRLRSAVAGARPAEAVADALRRYAGVEEVWPIPMDAKACDAATLAGQVLSERAPRSSVRKAIAALATAVLARRPTSSAAGPVGGEGPAVAPSRAAAANLTD